jgi:hypothetical protein
MTGIVTEQLGRALEEAFFARQNEEALARLRRAEQDASRRQGMAAATGIADEALLDRWLALDLGPRTVAALALVPFVLVAWADGSLDAKERAALRDAAEESGFDLTSEAADLLRAWTDAPPPRSMEGAWHDYVHALTRPMDAAAREALHQQTLGRARRIAEAAGGFLGLGQRVSAAEAAVLARLDRAFD